jgi:hypothetical protein
MFVFVLILLIILLLFFFPYIKRAFGRAGFIGALKKECLLKRYKLKKKGFFSLYFCNLSDDFDIEIDTGKQLFAIKLWDGERKNTNVVFAPGGRVYRRRKVVDVFGDGRQKTHTVLESKYGVFELAKGSSDANKYTRRFLVLDGTANMYRYDGKESARIKRGDELYGMTVILRTDILKNISAKYVS